VRFLSLSGFTISCFISIPYNLMVKCLKLSKPMNERDDYFR